MRKEVNKLSFMSGFVGAQARRRRRNFLSFGFAILIILILIFPLTETNNEIIQSSSIVPDPSKDLTSLASNIEELELNIFQKDQKIKFRDGQIKNLQIELKETKSQYDTAIIELGKIKNDFNTLKSNNENLVESDKFKIYKINLII